MKNILLLAAASFYLTGCASILIGKQKSVVFIDAPSDLKVTNLKTGEKLNVQMVDAGGKRSAVANSVTYYSAPGVKFQPRKGTVLQLEIGNKMKTITINTKPMLGTLILEGFISFGLFAAIDIIAGGATKHSPGWVDVAAVLSGNIPRSEKELKIYMMEHSHVVN
jgi:hypothetical protein